MRMLYIITGIIAGLLLLLVGFSWMKAHARKPEVLIARLRDCGPQEKEEVMTQIRLARGDFTTPVIAELENPENPPAFRAELIKILYQIGLGSADPRIKKILDNSLHDRQPEVRRSSIGCLAIYASSKGRLRAIGCLDDPDPEVRRQAYLILNADGRRPKGELWSLMSAKQRAAVIAHALRERKTGASKEIRFLARSVIGREIAILCDESTEALQTSDFVKAEELLQRARKLDPDSFRAKSAYLRYYLALGEPEQAIASAEEYGMLLRIPRLTAAPRIDGDPTDKVWQEGLKTGIPYLMTSLWTTLPAKARSEVSIGHLNGVIYISVIAYEDDLKNLVIKNTTRDSQVYMDDCVEFSFAPDSLGRRDYRFSINAAGALFDRYGRDWRKNFQCEYAARIFPERGYWACEFAVAAKALNNRVLSNASLWSMNVMRTRIGNPEKSAIRPTFGTMNISAFPLAVFADAPPPPPLPEAGAGQPSPAAPGTPAPPTGSGYRRGARPGMPGRPRGGYRNR